MCVCELRIVSRDKILCFKNTFIIIVINTFLLLVSETTMAISQMNCHMCNKMSKPPRSIENENSQLFQS